MEERLSGHSITAVVSSLSSSSGSPKSRVRSDSHPSSVCLSGLPFLFWYDKSQVGNKLCSYGHISVRLFILILVQCIVANLNHCNATEEIPSISIRVVALGPKNLLGWNIGVCFVW